MEGGEILRGEAIEEATYESVNRHFLQRIDTQILSCDPEDLPKWGEVLAKYNSSLRNNEIFTPEESETERKQKARSATVADILKGGNG